MKLTILLLAVSLAALSSCTTSYKTGQTPDDVYYSPSRPLQEKTEVVSEQRDESSYRNDDEYYDDRYLRMKVHNRSRWSDLNDWYYYDKHSLGYNYYFGSYYNPYTSWNYYYNPYCCCHTNNLYSNPKTSYSYSKPRIFNLGSYSTGTQTTGNSNPKFGGPYTNNSPVYNSPANNGSTNRSNNSGNILRNIFNSNNSGSNNSNHTSSGSNNNSGSSGSSS